MEKTKKEVIRKLEQEINSYQKQRKVQKNIISFCLNTKLKQLERKEQKHLKEWTKTEKIINKLEQYGKL